MKAIRQFFRLFHINFVLTKHGLDKVVLSIPLLAPIRFLAYLNPWNWFFNKESTRGERIRCALEELGPIFVKFGQTLSTRSDLLPEDIINELSKLQDDVPPFSSEQAIKLIEKEYGQSIEELFKEFSALPKASASVAQVHEVKLHNGKHAVIKILRPGIEKVISGDLDILYTLAYMAEKYWSQGPRLHPVEVVEEFERIIFNELDLLREAANASQLRRNFLNSKMLYIPEIYWDYAREKAIVMEYIHGIPVADIDTLTEHKINLKKLGERGVEIFFTQVFRDSFFHADMHPGNIFVNPENPEDPQYIAVDFGIMGSLSGQDQNYLAGNMLAFFKRDYRRVAELHIESGWVPADTRIDEFESSVRTVCEPIFERPIKEISFGRTLMRLYRTGRKFNMEVQPQLVLLQKTLLHIEGLGRRLYPDLDLWSTAKPFLENWMQQRKGPAAFAKKVFDNAPDWLEKFPEMPGLTYQALTALSDLSKRPQNNKTLEPEQEKNPAGNTKWRYTFYGIGVALTLTAIINFLLMEYKDIITLSAWTSVTGLSFGAIVALLIAGLFSRE